MTGLLFTVTFLAVYAVMWIWVWPAVFGPIDGR